MHTNIIEFSNVSYKVRKNSILTDVSFTVKEKSIHALIGPNGAGKSTILKLALGLILPSSGNIKITDRSKIDNNALKDIGALIESVSLYNHLTVFENLLIGSFQHKVKKERLFEILDIIKLTDHKGKKVKHISTGMKQKLGIGLALIHKPKVLLLDEPTNGLDPEGIAEIRELLIYLNTTFNVAIFLSSHLLDEVDKLSNDLTLVKNGKVVFTGNSRVFNKSDNFEKNYLESIL